MTERQWWSVHVRPRWHRPKDHCIALKVQDAVNSGFPDTVCCFNGREALIELKYIHDWPARPSTPLGAQVSVEQMRHLDMWNSANGFGLVLLGVEKTKEWFLLEPESYPAGATKSHVTRQPILKGIGWPSLEEVPKWLMMQS